MKLNFRSLAAGVVAFALALASVPQIVFAAATTQTLHSYLCRPISAGVAPGPGRVVNTSSTTTPAPAYSLNAAGCAVIAAADVGFFLSQGYTYGPNTFTMIQTGITATQTSSTSTLTLPQYAFIKNIILEETAGNAITGGVDIGDATSATEYVSAQALGANGILAVPNSALVVAMNPFSGVPASDQILVKCHTSCNSGSINILIEYGFY